jgi:hypothetical protein
LIKDFLESGIIGPGKRYGQNDFSVNKSRDPPGKLVHVNANRNLFFIEIHPVSLYSNGHGKSLLFYACFEVL